MAITRTQDIDDDGTGTTGTIRDNAWKQQIYDQIDASLIQGAGSYVGSAVTGTVHDLSIPLTDTTFLMWSGTGPTLLTGVAGGSVGRRLTIRNNATGPLSLAFNSGSAAGNRFYNTVTSAATPLGFAGTASYFHNGVIWLPTAVDQGEWIAPPYSAANFTGNGAMTWTVEAGDISALLYRLSGRQLTVRFNLFNMSIGGTLNTALQLLPGAYGGFTLAPNQFGVYARNDPAYALAEAGGVAGAIQLFNGPAALSVNWPASTNAMHVRGTLTFEVT